MAISIGSFLPSVDAPKSTVNAIYGAGIPLVILYALYEGGMPEDATEWVVSIVLLLVAAGFALNFFTVQMKPAGATA